ncbi:MAG: phosphate ABC transporter substrate-binding protein [Proteobacteria bacterium]|nr:phosphate ABC transporter substrate-binding protein [Pseudomonadota bacterium]
MKLAAAAILAFALLAPAARAEEDVVREALTVQKARNAAVAASKAKHYYTPGRFDLHDLPAYVPQVKVNGTIRIWTSDMWGGPGFQDKLAAAFRRHQPGAKVDYVSASPGGAFAGLLTGLADVAIARRMTWVDLLSFLRKFNRDPVVIAGMTGWWVNPPFVIAVHKDNPIASLSIEQIDGVFGAERDGGWKLGTWDTRVARGPEKNIRSWGQLSLTGEWANKPIDVFGYNLQYLFAPRFSDDVLQGSSKWNERLRQFTISASPDGKLLGVDQQMADALAADRQAVAYYAPDRGVNPATRHVPIRLADGRIVAATINSVRDHSYPLFDNMWIYANRGDDGRLAPSVREFLRFVLSRDAQQEVNIDTTMLPLTAALVAEQSRVLDK